MKLVLSLDLSIRQWENAAQLKDYTSVASSWTTEAAMKAKSKEVAIEAWAEIDKKEHPQSAVHE